MMRIGIDYTPAIHQTAGIGRYVRELVRALAVVDHEHQFTLFTAGGRASASDVWGGKRVLLVSDGSDMYTDAKDTLESAGYQVEVCRPPDTVQTLDETKPDIVVASQPTSNLRSVCAERGILVMALMFRDNRPRFRVPNFRVRAAPVSDVWLARLWHRLRIPVPITAFTGAQELFHATDFVLPPTPRRTRALLTVHDLSFVRDPDSAPPALRQYLNNVVPVSVTKAQHVLADSVATKNDIVELYSVPPEKVTVLYSGVDPRFSPEKQRGEEERIRKRYKLGSQPFVLGLGTLHPRKNYNRLIYAFAQIADVSRRLDGRPITHNLVIVGKQGWLFDSIKADAARLGLRTRLIFPGYAEDDDLPALYRAADLFVFPSLYEGFGLPPLEAMACGTPVITSNVSSLPEVVGDAGLTIDPTDIYELANAMSRALQDRALREQMVNSGLARASEFTWLGSARQLREIYKQISAQG